jgi:hypothetical protein
MEQTLDRVTALKVELWALVTDWTMLLRRQGGQVYSRIVLTIADGFYHKRHSACSQGWREKVVSSTAGAIAKMTSALSSLGD